MVIAGAADGASLLANSLGLEENAILEHFRPFDNYHKRVLFDGFESITSLSFLSFIRSSLIKSESEIIILSVISYLWSVSL